MILSIKERINLLSILPREGNLITLKIVRKTQNNIGFSSEEIQKLKFQTFPDGRISWDINEAEDKEVDLDPIGLDIIREELRKLDAQRKLNIEHLSLWEKFIGSGDISSSEEQGADKIIPFPR